MVAPYYEPLIDEDTGEQMTICGFPCVLVSGFEYLVNHLKAIEEYRIQAMMKRLNPREDL